MNNREKFICLVGNEPLKKSEAIILLEGDGFFRVDQAVKLYKANWADKIIISGGLDNPAQGSYPAEKLLIELVNSGVVEKDIVLDFESQNTREQAENVLDMAKQRNWKRLILVASPYHQYRAFLTFLKRMQEINLDIEIINAPSRDLSWFIQNDWGSRFDLLESEFEKIEKYQTMGHVALFEDAIEYKKKIENNK